MSLEDLMRRAQLWRAGEAPAGSHPATGFPALDALLGPQGWPCPGLVEILAGQAGIGALRLLLPALAALGRRGRWLIWVAPPHIPYAPALLKRGVNLERMLIVDGAEDANGGDGVPARGARRAGTRANSLWTLEQALRFADCGAALAWLGAVDQLALRRLKLACEAGGTLGVMFRPLRFAGQPSPATVRLALAPGQDADVLRIRVLKGGRGSRTEHCELAL